MKNFKLIS